MGAFDNKFYSYAVWIRLKIGARNSVWVIDSEE